MREREQKPISERELRLPIHIYSSDESCARNFLANLPLEPRIAEFQFLAFDERLIHDESGQEDANLGAEAKYHRKCKELGVEPYSKRVVRIGNSVSVTEEGEACFSPEYATGLLKPARIHIERSSESVIALGLRYNDFANKILSKIDMPLVDARFALAPETDIDGRYLDIDFISMLQGYELRIDNGRLSEIKARELSEYVSGYFTGVGYKKRVGKEEATYVQPTL